MMKSLPIRTMTAAFAACAIGLAGPAWAVDFGVGVGGIDCDSVKRQITRDWTELRDFFRPGQKDLRRPRSREFVCVSPYYTQGEMPTRERSMSLTCYQVQGTRFCCDKRNRECAAL